MALNTVTITWDENDPSLSGLSGDISFTLNTVLTDTDDGRLIHPIPQAYTFTGGSGSSKPLVANDSSSVTPSGSWYIITIKPRNGDLYSFQAQINYANGATQALGGLVPLTTLPAMGQFLPLPSGTPQLGEVPVASGVGEASTWALPISMAPQAVAANLTAPAFVAHRGGGSSQGGIYQGPYPENFLETFRAVSASGSNFINCHVRMTADRALVLMHDSTPDRTTNATGSVNVSLYSGQNWRQLTGTPQSWLGVNWGTIYPPFFDDLLREFGGKALILAEADSAATTAQPTGSVGTALASLISARGLTQCTMVSSFQAAELTAPAAAGIQTIYLPPDYPNSGSSATSIASAMASGWGNGLPKHVGINAFADTQANITTYIGTLIAAGFRVWVYTVIRRRDYAWLNAAGVFGYATDEPLYLPATAPINKSGQDPTALSAVWPHGLLPADQGHGRGNVQHGGIQQDAQTLGSSFQAWNVYGSLCPIVNAASTYTISDTITYDVLDTDATRWAGLYICCADDSKTSGNSTQGIGIINGYQVFLRQNGQLQVFKITAPSTSVQVGSTQNTQSISAGQSATLSVQVTPTQIIVTPTVNGTGYGPFTFTDSTYRGGYFHIGKATSTSNTAQIIVTHKNVSAA